MMKRTSLVAAAVASVCAGPVMAQDLPEVYGRVNVAIQSVNDEGVSLAGADEGLGLTSIASRVGVMGDHELGNGLTGLYRYEFGVDATEADIDDNNRLSWIGLQGDFGLLKAGKMWTAWYDYLGWNTERSQNWGGPGYYGYGYGSSAFNANMATTRASDTLQYTYGGGGYSNDPFTFTLEAQMNPDSAGGTADGNAILDEDDNPTGNTADPQDFDVITAAAQGTFGDFSVNGAYRQLSANTEEQDADPSQMGVGLRWESGPLYVGGSYIQTDLDDDSDSDSPSVIEVLASYDFGGGLNGQLSVSQLDADRDDDEGDTTGVYAQINQSLSEQMYTYVEAVALDVDGGDGGDDTSPTIVLVGMAYNF